MGDQVSVYVEILIRAPIEAVWAHTQTPDLHEQWDLRFSSITYLPKEQETDPQRFRYTTRIGFGFAVSGDGLSVGSRDLDDGSQVSALRFGSDHPISIIRQGSGYWKYVPTTDGVRFLTSYDYRTRFGRLGGAFDRMVFRPLIGWATAWSFDRLRLWLERGVTPQVAARQAAIHAVARVGLATVFFYEGLVPKLLGPSQDEIAMLRAGGLPEGSVPAIVAALGGLEMLFGLALLATWRRSLGPWLCTLFAVSSLIAVALTAPRFLGAAFNPVTLNVAVLCLAVSDLLTTGLVPSAARCKRRPER
jgi:uncharacterized membrane protein YphA (DoxX/SURF4 family)